MRNKITCDLCKKKFIPDHYCMAGTTNGINFILCHKCTKKTNKELNKIAIDAAKEINKELKNNG